MPATRIRPFRRARTRPAPLPPDADFFLASDAEVAEFERWLEESNPWPPADDEADRMAAQIEADWLARQEAGEG